MTSTLVFDIHAPQNTLLTVNMSGITKLTTTNYVIWSRQVRALLEGHELHHFLEDSKAAPSPTITVDGVVSPNPAFVPWRRQDKLLYSSLIGTITLPVQTVVSTANTTKEVWEILAQTFGQCHIPQLKLQNKACCTKGTKTVSEYLRLLKSKLDDLELLGKPMDAEELIQQVLAGLGEEYKPETDAILRRDTTISFSELYDRLLNREAILVSSSRQTLDVRTDEIEVIPDVEVTYFGIRYVFSDGIGKISAKFAREVAKRCDLQFTPSAFQIRYGGYKGVVAVDPKSSKKLSLRDSMCKFESRRNTHLDVLGWSKYQPCYLNRQIITLLSTLGVKDEVFEKKQREIVDQLDRILTDPQEALSLMAPGENKNIIEGLISCGYKPDAEPFLSMMLENFRASKLLELRTKTRIFVSQGRSMMGCLDETRKLRYGQVFVQCTNPMNPEERISITGTVVVAKNPCLHPGDILILDAIHVQDLDHLVDCIVFPQKGSRPHPNECSGSDLDGDIYFVCWDPELIPPDDDDDMCEPMDYNPKPVQILDHDVTTQEIVEYFSNYIDSLGMIANAHTVFADKEPLKAFSEPCLELAEKFSTAMDFPKTGVAAEIPQHLYVKEYPDFMEKLDKPSYESENVIGKLFREVKEAQLMSIKSLAYDVGSRYYDKDMEVEGFESYIKDALNHKEKYDYKLRNLMDSYGIKTEAEILGGGGTKKGRDAESMGRAVRSLRKEALHWFNGNDKGKEFDESAKASAWYYVTYHHSQWVYKENCDHFLSFAWCVYDKLVKIKKANISKRQTHKTLEGFENIRMS